MKISFLGPDDIPKAHQAQGYGQFVVGSTLVRGEGDAVETPKLMMPAREMERMMKLQNVILKAMAKKLTWIEAAKSLA